MSLAPSSCHCQAAKPLAMASEVISSRRKQIIVCNRRQDGVSPPDREEIKRETRDEQRNREVNDHRMLGMLREESGSKIKWVHMVTA